MILLFRRENTGNKKYATVKHQFKLTSKHFGLFKTVITRLTRLYNKAARVWARASLGRGSGGKN